MMRNILSYTYRPQFARYVLHLQCGHYISRLRAPRYKSGQPQARAWCAACARAARSRAKHAGGVL